MKHFLVRLWKEHHPYTPLSEEDLNRLVGAEFENRETANEGDASRELLPKKGGNLFISGNKEFPDAGEALPSNEEWQQMKGGLFGARRS